MIKRESDNVVWLEFEIFQDFKELVHAIFLRHGGHSAAEFHSLNFGSHQGDAVANVSKNIVKAQNILGLSKMAWTDLKNGPTMATIEKEGFAGEADALATNQRGIGLMVTHADCQAVVIYDPVSKTVANLHVGWRGNVANIFQQAIVNMRKTYGVDPKNFHVGISPSLGPEDAQFINYRKELPEAFWKFQVKPEYFNLWEISKQQLIDAGVPADQIQIAGISTLSNPHDYFSYRRIKASGRHATIVALR